VRDKLRANGAYGQRQAAAQAHDRTDGICLRSGPIGADHTSQQLRTGLVVQRA
jgi:hypothetical protein